jgi:hypothetical protein
MERPDALNGIQYILIRIDFDLESVEMPWLLALLPVN